jgi:hypothetical protein
MLRLITANAGSFCQSSEDGRGSRTISHQNMLEVVGSEGERRLRCAVLLPIAMKGMLGRVGGHLRFWGKGHLDYFYFQFITMCARRGHQ